MTTKHEHLVNVRNGIKGFISIPLEERVKRKINKGRGCWTYGKYGENPDQQRARIYVNGNGKIASRVIWELFFGKIPKGMLVCHKCDNGFCVNPKHLFLGTQSDNMKDSAIKGRRPSKISSSDVKKLRKDHEKNKLTQRELAKKYGISQAQVGNIVSRRHWNHV